MTMLIRTKREKKKAGNRIFGMRDVFTFVLMLSSF